MSSISSRSPKIKDINGSWIPPPSSFLKLSFYGASKGNPRPTGFSCVVRDSNGVVIQAYAGPLGSCNALKVEIMGLLMGIRALCNLNASKSLIEGDSTVVIGWVKGIETGG